MDTKKTTIRQVKSKIKRLYRQYDSHLDCIVELDQLIHNEGLEIQRCLHEIKETSHYLSDLAQQTNS